MGFRDKDVDIDNVNCDELTQKDFVEFEGDDLFDVTDYFWEYIQDAKKKGYMVYGQPVTSAPKSKFKVFDHNKNKVRNFLNFCSYNYLGYSNCAEVKKAVQEAIDYYGTGAVSAPLFTGYYDITQKLEVALAQFKAQEAAMVFPTGYSTNVGVLSGLLKPRDVAVLDVLSHTSIYDGVQLAGARIKTFSHNNPKHLETILKRMSGKRVIVCVEGVYSMDGDIANLPEIVPICKKYGAKLFLDEAHSSLVFGKRGAGVAEYYNVEDQVDIAIGTFSKAFGAIGGFAVGNKKLIMYLKMYANSYVFSCAMAPHTAAGILKILEVYKKDKSKYKKLWQNIKYTHKKLKEASLDIGNTKSQVVPVMVGDDLRLREISRRIQKKGLLTGVVTYPAVSKKHTRLRLSVSSQHSRQEIDKCVEILEETFDEV